METYNFIYLTKTGECKQVETNAETEEEAWKLLMMMLPDEITYVDLLIKHYDETSTKFT